MLAIFHRLGAVEVNEHKGLDSKKRGEIIAANSARKAMKTGRPKVLIVEDEARNIKLLEEMVAPMGVETCIASSSSQAMEMARTGSPDLILVDIMMPGLDGIEMDRLLKQDRATRNIPVVYVTGGVGFITKPVLDILVETSVRNALRMKQLSDEVERLMRQRASLTHMIIHDINNLLAVSLGYASMLLSIENLEPTIRKAVTAIEKSGRDLQIITSSLLDVEKLESGTLQIFPEAVNMWELAADRAGLLASQTEARGIRLELQRPTEDVTVRADRGLLSRVLDNLLFNAIKFCPDHGSVSLGVSSGDGTTATAITNDGPPIPPEHHERIFEKFAQVEVGQATDRKGVGLGLAFCKMAVEAMKGTIAVESPVAERKGGVRFVFRLPVAKG